MGGLPELSALYGGLSSQVIAVEMTLKPFGLSYQKK